MEALVFLVVLVVEVVELLDLVEQFNQEELDQVLLVLLQTPYHQHQDGDILAALEVILVVEIIMGQVAEAAVLVVQVVTLLDQLAGPAAMEFNILFLEQQQHMLVAAVEVLIMELLVLVVLAVVE